MKGFHKDKISIFINFAHINSYKVFCILKLEKPDSQLGKIIQIENGKGFRKKLKPQFDGTYDTSKDVESLSTATTNGSILLRYSTPLSEWEEKLVQLDSLSFSVVNDEGVTYRYNRFEPIKIQQ